MPATVDEAREVLLTKFSAQERSIVQIKLDDVHAYRKGNLNAQVVILEFTDYGCSRCQAFYLTTFPRIESELLRPGLVTYVSLNFYLKSPDAAQAALAAGKLGKFWEMKNLLLTRYEALDEKAYLDFARELKLDPAAFLAAYRSDEIAHEVDLERTQGRGLGVKITPTFIVGWKLPDGTLVGARISGPKPWTFFRDLVNQMVTEP